MLYAQLETRPSGHHSNPEITRAYYVVYLSLQIGIQYGKVIQLFIDEKGIDYKKTIPAMSAV